MKVLQVHCYYRQKGGEDSVVASEKELLQSCGITVEELRFDNNTHVVQKLLQAPFNLRAYLRTRRKIKAFRPDVVHIHNLHFAASASVIFAIRKSNLPFVQTLHNYRLLCPSGILYHQGKIFLDSLTQRFPWSAIFAGVYRNSRLLTGWLSFSMQLHHWIGTWQKADRYIVLTQHAQNLFRTSRIRFKPGQLTVKPNFSVSGQSPVYTPNDHFVFTGRLSEEKGIRLLLKVFSSLPYRLKIAGDGPLREEVVAHAAKHQHIEYAGPLAREDIFPFLTSGAVLVFPSTWYEGMPMVIIEAFACGLPVIASRLGAMEEMIRPGYNGFHFEAGQPGSLQQAIISWLGLTQKEKNLYRANAWRTYLDHYTPEKNARQLLDIYKDVITR